MAHTSEIRLGENSFRIHAIERGDEWVATAERVATGDRFGLECAAASAADAVGRLVRWLTWQNEHESALAALQSAERAYHRTVVDGSVLAGKSAGASAFESQRESLAQMEGARVRLDDVRGRRPS